MRSASAKNAASALSAELVALKARIKATWVAGDFGEIAKHTQSTADEFMRHRGVKPGMKVLDVACGSGNLAIPAARAGAVVTGIDIAPNLLDEARIRADHEGLNITLDEGDAEDLPYEDGVFDLVVTMFGAMFAPRPELAAQELLRVCRPGGTVAMANWTPAGFVGDLFGATSAHLPAPAGLPAPTLWGDEATVRQRLGGGAQHLQMTPVLAQLKYPFSVPETVEFYRRYFGPIQTAFAALPADKQPALRRDIEAQFAKHNRAADGTTHVEAEYLEVVAKRA